MSLMSPATVIDRQTSKALRKLVRRSKGSTTPISAAEVAEMKKILGRHRQNTSRLHRAWRNKPKAKFAHVRDHYLASFPARLSASVRALARRGASKAEIYKLASEIDVSKPVRELVRVEVHPKAKGGYRLLHKSGPRRESQRFIVRDLLTVMGFDNDFDYARPGGGGEKMWIGMEC